MTDRLISCRLPAAAVPAVLCVLMALQLAPAQEQPILHNGDFEKLTDATPGASGWTLGDPPQIADGWSLNSAYTGRLTIGTQAPQSGERYLHIEAPEGQQSHIYQIRNNLQVDQWYRISLWVRGGPVSLHVYEYFTENPMRVPTIAQGGSTPNQWREISGYYRPGGADFRNAGPAIAVAAGAARTSTTSPCAARAAGGTDVGPDSSSRNDSIILTLRATPWSRSFVSKGDGED